MNTQISRPVEARVLVVDDDPQVCELVARYLADHDIQVTAAASGEEMRRRLDEGGADLIVLDGRLPDADGAVLARELRKNSAIPIIMLTGRNEEADRVMCLELGADDYLTKPFSPRELLARIRARLRRASMQDPLLLTRRKVRAYRFDGWELDVSDRTLTSANGVVMPLRKGELNLLMAFLSAPNRTLTRGELLDLSRLDGSEVYERAIDVHVGRLRKHIEPDLQVPRYILTERGAGYVFKAIVEVVLA